MSDFIFHLHFKYVEEEFLNAFLVLIILNVLCSQRDDMKVPIINRARKLVGVLNLFFLNHKLLIP